MAQESRLLAKQCYADIAPKVASNEVTLASAYFIVSFTVYCSHPSPRHKHHIIGFEMPVTGEFFTVKDIAQYAMNPLLSIYFYNILQFLFAKVINLG